MQNQTVTCISISRIVQVMHVLVLCWSYASILKNMDNYLYLYFWDRTSPAHACSSLLFCNSTHHSLARFTSCLVLPEFFIFQNGLLGPFAHTIGLYKSELSLNDWLDFESLMLWGTIPTYNCTGLDEKFLDKECQIVCLWCPSNDFKIIVHGCMISWHHYVLSKNLKHFWYLTSIKK
jgi:hypothetical protein